MNDDDILPGSDGRPRCRWCVVTPEVEHYHDTEWGFPVADDRRLFEKLCLESFEPVLPWRILLARRTQVRQAFDDFDIHRIARYDEFKIRSLLQSGHLVRDRGRIEAVVHNAGRAVRLQKEAGSLAAFFWRYASAEAPAETPADREAVRPQTALRSPESVALSRELKRRGWQFVGPPVVHAFREAMGLVNGHAEGCVIRETVRQAREAFRKP